MNVETADSLLQTFVSSRNSADGERALSELVTIHAAPIARRIIRYKTSGSNGNRESDAEDIESEVMLQLVARLQRLRDENSNAKQIESFESYVAAATYNACDRFLSRKRPNRRRLKNGLRYLLTHRQGFNCWQNERGEWVGGLARWQFAKSSPADSDGDQQKLLDLRDDARAFARGRKTESSWHDQKHAFELLAAVFAWTNQAVELDLLTNVCAVWWNVTDETVELDRDFGTGAAAEEKSRVQIADSRPSIHVENEQKERLQKLWNEISELPPRQRHAVLLNLRDEQNRGIIDLWMIVGVATVQQIARALEMSPEEFARLWRELPLDDNQIAARLGLTRQQVINLRKSARERLARRMRGV